MKVNIKSLEDFKGMVCNHKITNSFMIIQSVSNYKDSILLNCLVKVKEEKETYFANVSYSVSEVILTYVYIQDIIKERQQIIGVQLELF
ncbi:hypothetical protein SAMN05444408_11547 [Chryseobacterium takakiae]|uniref:Uncharacterized protein n=1 Tax=Chryseobacterium takakiae TaxID=1302685 RepID=A0A1M5AW60_9FLAO|nr:hypothetical protein SAMN05444408_11547 [Chryseobacterium takakiae]